MLLRSRSSWGYSVGSRGDSIGSGDNRKRYRYMSTLNPFNLIGHYRGVGSSLDATTLTTPDYLLSYMPYIPSSLVSSVKWIDANQSGTPDKRAFRAFHNCTLAYLLSVKMKSANWQTRLIRCELGQVRFLRPSHVHCLMEPLYIENDPFATPGYGLGNLFPGDYYRVFVNGVAIPNPVFELYHSSTSPVELTEANLIARIIGDSSGNVGYITTTVTTGHFARVLRSNDGYYRELNPPMPTGAPTNRTIFYRAVNATGKLYEEIWPSDTFTAWGAAWIPRGKDWMPPVVIEATPYSGPYGYDPQPLEYDCHLTLWRLDNDTYTRSLANSGSSLAVLYGGLNLLNNTVTPTPFPFSQHEPLEPGWFRRKSTYPATFEAATADRWEPCPGSDPTGWLPPTTEPDCPFVAVRGTEE